MTQTAGRSTYTAVARTNGKRLATKTTGEILVNVTTATAQKEPAIAMDDSGNFVVSWQSEQEGGEKKETKGKRRRSSSSPSRSDCPARLRPVTRSVRLGSTGSPPERAGAGVLASCHPPDEGPHRRTPRESAASCPPSISSPVPRGRHRRAR